MRKLVIASVLTVMAQGAVAHDYRYNINGGIDYTYYDGNRGNVSESANALGITFGNKVLNWVDADVRSEFATVSTDTVIGSIDANTYKLEGGLTPYYMFDNKFGAYARAAIGYEWDDAYKSFGFGSIEPGLMYKPYSNENPTKINIGYRYRDDFDNAIDYESNAFVVGGEYAINSISSVVGRYEYVNGDTDYDVYRIGFVARF